MESRTEHDSLGEIAVEDEIILQARFTKFEFRDILSNQADKAGDS